MAQPSPTLGVVKVAVPAAGPGRVAEQCGEAGGSAWLTPRPAPESPGMRACPPAGSRAG